MEIDDKVANVVRTCLEEIWTVDKVTDEMVKAQIEMTLMIAVLYDLDTHDCPRTIEAMTKYYEDKGITLDEDEEAALDDKESS